MEGARQGQRRGLGSRVSRIRRWDRAQKGKLRCEHTFGLDNVSESRWDLSSSTDPGPNIWGVLTRTPGRAAGGSGWGGSFPGRQMPHHRARPSRGWAGRRRTLWVKEAPSLGVPWPLTWWRSTAWGPG